MNRPRKGVSSYASVSLFRASSSSVRGWQARICSASRLTSGWTRWRAASRFPNGACPACFCRRLSAVQQAGRPEAGSPSARKADQEIAEGCNRLIRNSIICWKNLYLTHKFKHWQKPRKSAKGCWTSSKPTHRSRGAVSTCSESSISRTRSIRIQPTFFPPKSRPKSSPKIGGRQIDDTDAVSIGYRKSYGRFHSTRLIAK